MESALIISMCYKKFCQTWGKSSVKKQNKDVNKTAQILGIRCLIVRKVRNSNLRGKGKIG